MARTTSVTRRKPSEPLAEDTSPRHTGSSAPGNRPLGALARGETRAVAVSIVGLFTLAILYTLHLARDFFIPVAFASLLALMFGPAVMALKEKLRVPQPLGSAFVLLFLLSVIVLGATQLSGPASRWLQRAPQMLSRVEDKIRRILVPVAQVKQAASEVERITTLEDGEQGTDVQVTEPDLSTTVMVGTRSFIARAVIAGVLLFFLLAYGNLLVRRAIRMFQTYRARRTALVVVKTVRSRISLFLGTITMINLGLGAAVGLSLALLGMPTPLFWGVMAMVLNFVPYLGGIVGVAVVAGVSVLSFESLGQALLPPLVYAVFTFTEGHFLTPAILGNRLRLNPLIVFAWLVLWGLVWGVPGVLLAVPMLATVKIVTEHVPQLRPLSGVIGR